MTKIKFNFTRSTTNETSCADKSNSFLTDADCNPVQLLPYRGCAYDNYNTDLGFQIGSDNAIRGDYYIDYCKDYPTTNNNLSKNLIIKDCPEN